MELHSTFPLRKVIDQLDRFFLSECCMAQRDRCPGGRPSVSLKQILVGIGNVATVQASDFMIQDASTSSLPESASHVGWRSQRKQINGERVAMGVRKRWGSRFHETIDQGVEATAENTHVYCTRNWQLNRRRC